MEGQEREYVDLDGLEEHELKLTLGLGPAPTRHSLHLKIPAEKPPPAVHEGSGDLSLTVTIWGKAGTGSEKEPGRVWFPDPPAKREEQALRRQEARKKRDEKRKSKANAANGSGNQRLLWFDKQRAAVRERNETESEGDFSERRRKRENGVAEKSFLVRPENGFNVSQLNGLPHLKMPGLVGSDRNGFQPVVGGGGAGNGGLRPYEVAEKNSGHGGGGVEDNVKQSVSSSRGSSPGVSDYQSTSGQGGSSSEGGNYSSHSYPLDLTITNATSNATDTQTSHNHSQPSASQPNGFVLPDSVNGKVECSSSSHHTEPIQTLNKAPKPVETANSSSNTKPCPGSDPSKPPVQQSNEALLLSQMPCVSTTGNGPNGKRVTGFLYRYTKSEVSIVCVCHGSSFSPAGFVKHAGGVDVENPLRHITVVPFAFS